MLFNKLKNLFKSRERIEKAIPKFKLKKDNIRNCEIVLDREELLSKIRKEFTKNKSASVKADGYNEFFLINAKTMKVENSNLDELKETSKKGDIKRIFGKKYSYLSL